MTTNDGGTIRELPKSTVRLIGSAQVITSVLSVVKELVENSLDAGATSIDVKLDNYGFDKIEVRDNGSGVQRADTQYMAQPHYTSKISSAEDLQNVETYGFRGEALGSLCCVANVSITTKTKDDPHSTTYTVNQHGQIMSTKPSHLGQGTTVIASNLFKNLPVRRQYYNCAKRRREELRAIEGFLIACGVVYPGIRFSLKHDKATVWTKAPMADVHTVLCSVLGASTMAKMVHIHRENVDPQVTIDTYLPQPNAPCQLVTRATNDRCFIFVNRRVVVVKEFEKVLRQCCPVVSKSESSRYPIAYVHVTMATSDVDVNLDPNKTKVLIQNKDRVVSFLRSLLEELYGGESTDDKENQNRAETETQPYKTETETTETLTRKCENGDKNGYEIQPAGGVTAAEIQQEMRPLTCDKNLDESKMTFDQILDSSLLADSVVEEKTSPSVAGSSRDQPPCLEIATPDNIPTSAAHPKSAPSGTLDKNSSIDELAAELLKDFEAVDDITKFDIPTPDLTRTTSFRPICSSTQSESVSNTVEKSTKIDNIQVCMAETMRNGPDDISPLQNNNNAKVQNKAICDGFDKSDGDRSSEYAGGFFHSGEEKKSEEDFVDWSKGTAIKGAKNNIIKPVSLLNVGALKQAPQTASPKPRTPLTTGTNKKRIMSGNHNVSIQQFLSNKSVAKQKVGSRQRAEKVVSFSLQKLKDKFVKGPNNLSSVSNIPDGLNLIGHLQSHGAWICCHNRKLTLFQPIRAQEEIVYQRMLANHRMDTERLEAPQEINADVLRSQQLFQALLLLRRSPPMATDPYTYITDPRITDNGLRIACRMADSGPSVQVTAVAACLKAYILSSLCEILTSIQNKPKGNLANSRPNRIKHYLQSEAVRMSRQLPPTTPREEARALLKDIARRLDTGVQSQRCFHNKPYFVDLYNLDELPQSQSSSQYSNTQECHSSPDINLAVCSSLDKNQQEHGSLSNST